MNSLLTFETHHRSHNVQLEYRETTGNPTVSCHSVFSEVKTRWKNRISSLPVIVKLHAPCRWQYYQSQSQEQLLRISITPTLWTLFITYSSQRLECEFYRNGRPFTTNTGSCKSNHSITSSTIYVIVFRFFKLALKLLQESPAFQHKWTTRLERASGDRTQYFEDFVLSQSLVLKVRRISA